MKNKQNLYRVFIYLVQVLKNRRKLLHQGNNKQLIKTALFLHIKWANISIYKCDKYIKK